MPSLPTRLGQKPSSFTEKPTRIDPRPDSTDRGYSYKWKQYSRARLAANPICVSCEAKGRSTLAKATDHIIPIGSAGEQDPLFWDTENHQSLCWSCHSRKTARERATGTARNHLRENFQL